MGSGNYGDRLARDIESMLQTECIDLRKAIPNIAFGNPAKIQTDLALRSPRRNTGIDGSRNHITGCKLINESLALLIY
jgi:hypothetical protein